MPKRALPVAEKEARAQALENIRVKDLAEGLVTRVKECAGWAEWSPAEKWAVVELVRRSCWAPRATRWCDLTAAGAPVADAQVLCRGEDQTQIVLAKYVGPGPKKGTSGIGYVIHKGQHYVSRTRVLRNWSK